MSIEQEHKELYLKCIKLGDQVLRDLTPEKAHLWHLATGVSGEAGELLDAIKKAAVYNKPLDIENVREELGDIEFYMRGIYLSLGISRDDVLRENIAKLSKRYEKGYSNKAAQERADKQ